VYRVRMVELVSRGRCLEELDVFVLSGGLGTRIQPVLGEVPKLLAPINGRPYLVHLLAWLKQFGARRVVLGLGHGASLVLEYLKKEPLPSLDIAASIEPSQLGTAGAIRFARSKLVSDPVLVMNGDSFVDADLCAFVERHRVAHAAGTLLCTEVDSADRYGSIAVGGDGRIQTFAEKQPGSGPAIVSAGVYLLSAPLLDRIAAGDAHSLESDVFQRLPPGSLAAFHGKFAFVDIGTPESLSQAAETLARYTVRHAPEGSRS
jgi:NDP-sugar pyrophosphorylase family protein